ncbi:MAG: thermonuclease family protein [Deltaproteobacteria bacterium]|nr:thermonuclease family protein [Deltaproteobacteria bacterium]
MPGIIAACIIVSAFALSSVVHADASGRASAIDGDTIEVGDERIRLHGIDAPESAQTCLAGGEGWRCGRRTTRAFRDRIDSQAVACEERDRGRYGRMMAVCREYVAEEASAKAARRGLWRGDFVVPWDWRANA